MKKADLIKELSNAMSMEELNLMAELNQAVIYLDNSDFDSDKKNQIRKKINILMTDTAKHAKSFVNLIRMVVIKRRGRTMYRQFQTFQRFQSAISMC